jgi:hypothetical protein
MLRFYANHRLDNLPALYHDRNADASHCLPFWHFFHCHVFRLATENGGMLTIVLYHTSIKLCVNSDCLSYGLAYNHRNISLGIIFLQLMRATVTCRIGFRFSHLRNSPCMVFLQLLACGLALFLPRGCAVDRYKT